MNWWTVKPLRLPDLTVRNAHTCSHKSYECSWAVQQCTNIKYINGHMKNTWKPFEDAASWISHKHCHLRTCLCNIGILRWRSGCRRPSSSRSSKQCRVIASILRFRTHLSHHKFHVFSRNSGLCIVCNSSKIHGRICKERCAANMLDC